MIEGVKYQRPDMDTTGLMIQMSEGDKDSLLKVIESHLPQEKIPDFNLLSDRGWEIPVIDVIFQDVVITL